MKYGNQTIDSSVNYPDNLNLTITRLHRIEESLILDNGCDEVCIRASLRFEDGMFYIQSLDSEPLMFDFKVSTPKPDSKSIQGKVMFSLNADKIGNMEKELELVRFLCVKRYF